MFDLKACLRGDKAAWDAFVERFGRVIFAAVSRTLRMRLPSCGDETVQDVAQDIFLRLVSKDFRLLRTYDPARAKLTTWLTIVSRSMAVDYLRRQRLHTVSLEDLQQGGMDPGETPADPVDPLHIPPYLLTDRQRLVLGLLFDQEKTAAQAAEILGVDAQTIRSTKHKALARLREHFKDRPP